MLFVVCCALFVVVVGDGGGVVVVVVGCWLLVVGCCLCLLFAVFLFVACCLLVAVCCVMFIVCCLLFEFTPLTQTVYTYTYGPSVHDLKRRYTCTQTYVHTQICVYTDTHHLSLDQSMMGVCGRGVILVKGGRVVEVCARVCVCVCVCVCVRARVCSRMWVGIDASSKVPRDLTDARVVDGDAAIEMFNKEETVLI